MKLKTILMLAAVAGTLCASAIETSIAYQGILRDAQGKELSSLSQEITFRLYSQASGGTPLWARAIAVNLDKTGFFNVELNDSGTSVDATAQHLQLSDALKAARGGSLYIGLEVKDSSGEIAPRQKIIMTPYSSWAADVTSAAGDFSVAGKATVKNIEVQSGLEVDGNATFGNEAVFSRNVPVSGTLTVKNTGSIEGYGTIPVGGIIMWSGSYIPNGWALCDGKTYEGIETPNLAERFVLGVSSLDQIKLTGGASSVTLTTDNLPPHSHKYAGDDQITNINDGNYSPGGNIVSNCGGYDAKSETKGAGKVYNTSKTGSGVSFSVMPPYYKLAYIMRIK